MKRNKKSGTKPAAHQAKPSAQRLVTGITLSALVIIPLIFSTHVHRYYSVPKFTALLVLAAILLPLVTRIALADPDGHRMASSKRRFTRLSFLFAYVCAIALSTLFGSEPRASLFGSFENRMGLVTYACFLICAVGLVLGVDGRAKRLRATALAISATALVVSVYGLAQFFGVDPFISPEAYTFNSTYGPIVRVASSLGHADYLGNFLLYTTPLSAALTLSLRSHVRWLTLVSAVTSLAVIAASGTRGAWLGILIGLACMVALVVKSRAAALVSFSRRGAMMAAGVALLIVAIAAMVIVSARGFHSISARAWQTVAEGMSGSGRTLLWRDALSMVPRYAFPGCGPEAFRLAFPLYRSEELSRLAPTITNESAHNSYLDAAVSFGLPGLVALVALIVATLVYFYRAWRVDSEPRTRLLTVGFLSSFVAVLTHNLFIFDQLTTGLYFFAFAALAVCALEVGERQADADAEMPVSALAFSLRARVVMAATLVVSAAAVWYGINSWSDDVTLRQMHGAARTGALDTVIARGNALTAGRSLTGDFDLQFASALTIALGRTPSAPVGGALPQADPSSRRQALDLAIEHAERGINHSLTPTTGHLLLGTLALMKGDKERLRDAAREAYRRSTAALSGFVKACTGNLPARGTTSRYTAGRRR